MVIDGLNVNYVRFGNLLAIKEVIEGYVKAPKLYTAGSAFNLGRYSEVFAQNIKLMKN